MHTPDPSHCNHERRRRGALMAAALMLMVAAGLVLSGWVTVMGARARQVAGLEDALHRRQSLLNTHVIGRQLLLERQFAATAEHSGVWQGVLTGPDGTTWGGAALPGGWSGNVFSSDTDAAASTTIYPFNASGLARGDAFLTVREMTSATAVWDKQDPVRSFGFIKMNCPPLRGDLFTVFKKPPDKDANKVLDIHTTNISPTGTGHFGQCVVEGRMVIKDVASLYASTSQNTVVIPARVRSLYIPEEDGENRTIVATSPTGAPMPPSNLAGMPMTVGSMTATGMWTDRLDVVHNDANPDNSLWHFMEREQAAGRGSYVTVDSSDFDMGVADPPIWVEKQRDPPGEEDPPANPDHVIGLTYPPGNWPSGYRPLWNVLFVQMDHPNLPHVRITAGIGDATGIHQVVFRGQAPLSAAFDNAALLPPVIIAIAKQPGQDRAPVQDIRFEHVNNRRWVLGLKTAGGTIEENLDVGFEGAAVFESAKNIHLWRCILVNESRDIYLNLRHTQHARIVGGIMTDWLFKRRRSTSGIPRNEQPDGLVFRLDSDPEPEGALGPKFSSLLPRDAWLETYFTLPDVVQIPLPP